MAFHLTSHFHEYLGDTVLVFYGKHWKGCVSGNFEGFRLPLNSCRWHRYLREYLYGYMVLGVARSGGTVTASSVLSLEWGLAANCSLGREWTRAAAVRLGLSL